jgi:hypothetical protein
MRSIQLLTVLFLFSCGTPQNEDEPIAVVDDVVPAGTTVGIDALLGEWQDQSDSAGTVFHEQWELDMNGSYAGLGFVLSGKDTVFIEHLAIILSDSGTYYTATTRTQNEGSTIHFKLVHEQDSLVFTNPTHDFPQRIVYAPGGADDWNVSVSGISKGEFAMDLYHFTRRTGGTTSSEK